MVGWRRCTLPATSGMTAMVALKVLHPELAGSLGTDRFLREIGIAARLQHPNILALFDSGTTEDTGGRGHSMPCRTSPVSRSETG